MKECNVYVKGAVCRKDRNNGFALSAWKEQGGKRHIREYECATSNYAEQVAIEYVSQNLCDNGVLLNIYSNNKIVVDRLNELPEYAQNESCKIIFVKKENSPDEFKSFRDWVLKEVEIRGNK